MKTYVYEYVFCRCITVDMIRQHADMYDNCFMGTIVLYSLGIRAACTTFCKQRDREGWYNLAWICDNGDEYVQSFYEGEILSALEKTTIKIEQLY